jgi:hypothetical protein
VADHAYRHRHVVTLDEYAPSVLTSLQTGELAMATVSCGMDFYAECFALDEVAALPVRQRDMLRGAVGLADAPLTPDLMLLGLGVLTLLTELAARRPLLLVVDDAQWIDSASLDALGFAARRLGRVPVTLLLGTRTLPLGAGLDRDHPVLELGPLDGVAAGLLLDTQPYPPTGRDRVRLLAQAAGNPLALVELARMYAAGAPSDGPLPVAEWIARLFTARIGALPPGALFCLPLRIPRWPPLRSTRWTGPPRSRPTWYRSLRNGCCSAIRLPPPPCTKQPLRRTGAQRIATSPPHRTRCRTAMPGTWPRRRCCPTSRSPQGCRPPRTARAGAAGTSRRRKRCTARPISAPHPSRGR